MKDSRGSVRGRAEGCETSVDEEVTFQEGYARLLTDGNFRVDVFADKPSTATRVAYSSVLDRLQRLDPQRVELFANLLIGNRIAVIEQAFPLTARALGETLGGIVAELSNRHPATDTRKFAEATRFADYVMARVEGGTLKISDWIPELLQYELAALRLRVLGEEPVLPGAECALRENSLFNESCVLIRAAAQVLLSIGFDLDDLRKQLVEGDRDVAPVRGQYFLLLTKSAAGDVEEYVINAPTATVLLLIDGNRTIAEIVSEFAAIADQNQGDRELTSLRRSIEQILTTMCEQRFVWPKNRSREGVPS